MHQFDQILAFSLKLGSETDCVEFKQNWAKPEDIGEYVSALANSAALASAQGGYLVWGVENRTQNVVGTKFRPDETNKGNEPLEAWLVRNTEPRLNLRFHEGTRDGSRVVILEIPSATAMPVRFLGQEYIRVGSSTRKLKDYPEKEKELWRILSGRPFEKGLARTGLSVDQVYDLIDYESYYRLAEFPPATDDLEAVIGRLIGDGLAIESGDQSFAITNLGAILFARDIRAFGSLRRKAVRLVFYRGSNRVSTVREFEGQKGYASGFEGLVGFIEEFIPRNEVIEQAIRREVPVFPTIAIRELAANMLIHQDFSSSGTGPMIEVFSDRVEITNPGKRLIETSRFLDLPPRSRNEDLASLMRRLGICEERGSGIDKVILEAEAYQLPAPDFLVSGESTKAVLYAPRKFKDMSREDRVRACYQHAGLCWVSNRVITNESLRKRFGIEQRNYPMASRVIADTLAAGYVKPKDPENKSRKHASYVPFWA